MRYFLVLAAVVLATQPAPAGEMKDELKVDAAHPTVLRTRFATYGYHPESSLLSDPAGLRFKLPSGVKGVGQTGIYSQFSLSGDCEVILNYELVHVQEPSDGYGSGLGLAFDAGDEGGRAIIQRVLKPKKESGYVLQTGPLTPGSKMTETYQLVPCEAQKGRIGLRRVKKELIFLATDDPAAEPEEIERRPFTEGTIRAVRLFADAGGSPTALHVRASEIQMRAEEITGGVPRREAGGWGWRWLWVLAPVGGVGLLIWGWRAYRRWSEGREAAPRRVTSIKKA
jgi:hypothetical protein